MKDHPAKSGSGNLASAFENAIDTASELTHAQAEELTETATRRAEAEVSNAANAAAAASAEFDADSVQAVVGDQIAAQLQDFVGVLRDADFNALAGTAQTFARQNPLLCLGGAAVIGFAAVRFLKASEPTPHVGQNAERDPWTGHVSAAPHPTQGYAEPHPREHGYQNEQNGRASA